MSEPKSDDAMIPVPREVAVAADSLLSWIWHRYVPHEIRDREQQEYSKAVYGLRNAYEKFDRAKAAGLDAGEGKGATVSDVPPDLARVRAEDAAAAEKERAVARVKELEAEMSKPYDEVDDLRRYSHDGLLNHVRNLYRVNDGLRADLARLRAAWPSGLTGCVFSEAPDRWYVAGGGDTCYPTREAAVDAAAQRNEASR